MCVCVCVCGGGGGVRRKQRYLTEKYTALSSAKAHVSTQTTDGIAMCWQRDSRSVALSEKLGTKRSRSGPERLEPEVDE